MKVAFFRVLAWSPEIQKYDKDTKKVPEDGDEVEEVTDELVVVVLQLILGVPAIAIVRHLLSSASGGLLGAGKGTSVRDDCSRNTGKNLGTLMLYVFKWISCICLNDFLWSIHLYFSQLQATYF